MTPHPSSPRLVIVVRHAKSEHSGVRDRDRRLTERGRGDASSAAAAVGAALGGSAASGEVVALVSSSARTYETWQQLAARLPVAVDERVSDELYDAGIDDVVDLVARLDDGVSAAIVVGHNPTMQATVHTLAGGGDPGALALLGERGFPTASVAVLAHEGEWSELAPDSCRLRAFDVGRG
ncbi:histidine phosphatase family protein [soil metagenome]